MEISAPSQQRLQQAEIEKQAREQSALTSRTVMKTSKLGEEIMVSTTSNYEQNQIKSRTDWRIRSLAATDFHLRLQKIEVDNNNIDYNSDTYVLPQNLIHKLICAADKRSQIGGYLYGTKVDMEGQDRDKKITELKCIVMPPQKGSHDSYTFAKSYPDSKTTEGLIPLGIIHTQPQEFRQLSPFDIMTLTNFICDHPQKVTLENSIVITAAITPGSFSLTGYRLTKKGFDWGKEHRNEPIDNIKSLQIRTDGFFEKIEMWLAERYLGYFLLPKDGIWNYFLLNMNKYLSQDNRSYDLELGNPLEFYHQKHRPGHFLQWNKTENAGMKSKNAVEEAHLVNTDVDIDNLYD